MQNTVIVTGASSGLGKAIAYRLHQMGYSIIGTSRNPHQYKTLPFPLLALDMNDLGSIDLFCAEIQQHNHSVSALINNAGQGITGAVEEVDITALQRHFDTNFFGPLALTQRILPLLRENGQGKIINITSIGASMGLPFRGGYSASKAALQIMSEALRMEVAQFGIEVATLAPGDYATDIAARRYYQPNKKDSPYAQLYQESLDTMNAHVDQGNDPIEIAEAVAKLLAKKA